MILNKVVKPYILDTVLQYNKLDTNKYKIELRNFRKGVDSSNYKDVYMDNINFINKVFEDLDVSPDYYSFVLLGRTDTDMFFFVKDADKPKSDSDLIDISQICLPATLVFKIDTNDSYVRIPVIVNLNGLRSHIKIVDC